MKLSSTILICASAAIIAPIYTHGQLIVTCAGGGSGGDGGPATVASIYEPRGVAIDINGNLYISDEHSVRMVNSLGIISTVAGNGIQGYTGDGGPATDAEIVPTSVAVDGYGNIYIDDLFYNVIRKVNSSGIITTIAGNGTAGYFGDGGPATIAELHHPDGVAVDSKGNIYVSDEPNFVIRKINPAGIISTYAGGGTGGDGGAATTADIGTPFGVAVDVSDNVYIVGGGEVRIVDTFGIINTIAGNGMGGSLGWRDGGPATAAGMNPLGVTIDNVGNIFIADGGKNAVRLVNTSGIISTYAGNGGTGFSGDGGLATDATFKLPVSVTVDQIGNLYIADLDNFRVRKVISPKLAISNPLHVIEIVKIYPNPTTGSFTVQLPQTNAPTTITVTNLLGSIIETRTIETTQPQNINFNLHAPPGAYIIKVTSGSNTWRDKIEIW